MMMTPKVSIVVAVYNVSEYVERCARSLFEQTLDDIEIIICDDASTDNSVQLIRDVLEQYPQRKGAVKFVCNETNQGLPNNRRNGVKAATGEYFLLVDGDDYLEVTMAEKLYAEAMATGADIVQCDLYNDTPDGMSIWESSEPGKDPKECLLNRTAWHNVWIRLFRRSLLDNDQLVWPVRNVAEDLVISTVLTVFAKKVVYLPIPLYHYNYNPNSIMNRLSEAGLVNMFEQQVANTNVLIDFLEKQGLQEQYNMGYVIAKANARNILLDLTNKWKYRKLWYRTYPEINKLIFWGDKYHPSSLQNKIWIVAIMLGLFPSCQRQLLRKRMHPSNEWTIMLPRKKKR